MTVEERRRQLLLQAFAEADQEYGRLLQKTAEVDPLLCSLKQELTKEQMDLVERIHSAYMELSNHTIQMACKYMIFPSETE